MNIFERIDHFLSKMISFLDQASSWLARSADYTLVLLSKATDFILQALNTAVHMIARLLKRFLITILKTIGHLLRLLAMILLLAFLWSYGEEVDAVATGLLLGIVGWTLRICALIGAAFVVASLLAALGKMPSASANLDGEPGGGTHNFGFFYFLDFLSALLVFVLTRWSGYRFHSALLVSIQHLAERLNVLLSPIK